MYWENIKFEKNLSGEKIYKRDIIKTKNFNVVIVNIGKNQEIVPHPEPYAVFFLVLEGSGVFTTKQGTLPLQKDSSIYYEKDEIRGIKSKEDLVLLGIQDPH